MSFFGGGGWVLKESPGPTSQIFFLFLFILSFELIEALVYVRGYGVPLIQDIATSNAGAWQSNATLINF